MSEINISDKKGQKIAVVLFNLGGPDSLENVKPFLFNLFNDKYIIRLPKYLRAMIAFIISTSRKKIAQGIYSLTGGKSPILNETEIQRDKLEIILNSNSDNFHKVFIVMRHWNPFAKETIEKIVSSSPDQIILLPLYPQFSTTTTLSSIEDFKDNWRKYGINNVSTKTICCYPMEERFIQSHIDRIKEKIYQIKGDYRILFSAHGLPEKIIEQGDPYQWQIEQTVSKIISKLSIKDLDYKITYQSRVGPMKWLTPNTEDEIKLACKEKKPLVIVPVAFVSEHVETLVELDIEYKKIAEEHNVQYLRVLTLSSCDIFLDSLANTINQFTTKEDGCVSSNDGNRICPKEFTDCPCSF